MIHYNFPLSDITDRITEPPKWWLAGIPRYCDYHPHHSCGTQVEILVKVVCGCGREFDIAISGNENLAPGLTDRWTGFAFWDAYPNPPFHLTEHGFNCADNHSGVTAIEVLEAWERLAGANNWKRRADLEGPALPFS